MTTTANIGLEILTEGQANKEASITASHETLDTLVQAAVIDRDLAVPPGSPSEGDCYLVAVSATGDWSGQDGNLAHYRNGAWAFVAPKEGWRLYVRDEDVFIIHNGAEWSTIGASVTVKEADGSPTVSDVTTIAVTNGTLTDDGGGQVTLDLSGSGGASMIAGFQSIWEQIDRVEFSGASSITVGGNQTPADYDCYLLLIQTHVSSDGAQLNLWASTDGGVTKVTDYVRQGRFWRSAGTDGDFGNESANSIQSGAINTTNSEKPFFMKLDLLQPGVGNHKPILISHGWPDDGGPSLLYSQIEYGWIEELSGIDSFVVSPNTGNITGEVVLLGLKKSETAGRLLVDSSTARILAADDNNRIIHFNNAGSGIIVTLPATLPEGFSCRIINDTGGSIALTGTGGLSLLGDTNLAQSRAGIVSRIGDTKANVVAL